jgi:hypothetical protein
MTAGGRTQPGVAEPAAERGRRGRGGDDPAGAEGDPDQLRSPGRMVATVSQSGLADRGGVGVGPGNRGVVVGLHGGFPALAEAVQQVTDGADREAEVGSQTGGAVPAPGPLEQLPPHGDRDRLGHGGGLLARGAEPGLIRFWY